MARGLKYHRTYYVPPKTALVGLLGAAIGLEDAELVDLYDSILTNAILADYYGTASDLWLITKLKTGGEPETSPIIREMLIEPQYWIYYAVRDSKIDLDKIANAFNDPIFALSLGRSDELIEVKKIMKVDLQHDTNEYFRNTILPFNYKDFFGGYEKLSLRKGQTFNLPQILSIPISFVIDDNRVRKPSKYLQVTLVYDIGVKIHGRKDGWVDEERRFFLY